MQYMGGKERQARHIVEQLLKHRGTATRYVEPFMGGASIFSRMTPHFPEAAYGSDTHPDLVLMWQAVLDGWEPPTEISREEYEELRTAEPSAVRAFAGFGCSFGGKWFGGYASNARGDDFCGAARRSVLKKTAAMKGAHVDLRGYEELSPGPGTLVYCDPPYAATTGYTTGSFDSDLFWSTMRGWADNGATILVSEYTAPDWAEEVWQREAVKSLRKDSNTLPAVEKLFLVRPTPVLAEAQPGRPPTDAEVESWKVNDDGTPFVRTERTQDWVTDDEGVLDLNQWQRQASAAAKRYVALAAAEPHGQAAEDAVEKLREEALDSIPAAEPDPFDTPATAPKKLNVSGQPDARRDHQKRYILVDPDLGDFRRTVKERKPKGITRATTFNKAAQNTTALNAWGKRNVVMGASLRPDILRRAHGLNHETGKQELDRIVDELETAAGAKVAADEGTFLHGFCDQVDAGLKTWRDAPPAYQQDIKRYVEALAAAGLEPVPGLIERTTFIREFGGVAGTFDRIFYHRPSDRYIVGDLKTGKTMSYAMDETECQIWTYAHGVNQTGIYDWNTDTWETPYVLGESDGRIEISEKVGVIVHMPVQGPEAGEVHLRFANLESGRAYAELNYAVRSYPKSKVQSFDGSRLGPEPVAAPPATHRDWHAEFRAVTSREQANALYAELEAFGANEEYLAVAVVLGKQALSGVDNSS